MGYPPDATNIPSPIGTQKHGISACFCSTCELMIRVALIYPNTYHVGMSNLGFQTVYALFNSFEHVACEIAFLSDDNRITILNPAFPRKSRERGESSQGWSLSDADIIAFSVSFENDYPNILTILEKAEVPLLSRDRGNEYPLIIAGGVACFLNPEPIAPFIDCFLLGEAENILPKFFEIFEPDTDRNISLKNIARHVPVLMFPNFIIPFIVKTEHFSRLNCLKMFRQKSAALLSKIFQILPHTAAY